ncbi:hypothetical protein OHR68_10045 [Spirillospora sp. NBC_00431]
MKQPPEGYSDLADAGAAYTVLMNSVVVPESQYKKGARDVEKEQYLGDIIERAAARRRERDRPPGESP